MGLNKNMRTLIFLLLLISATAISAEDSAGILSPRNLEAPFCYVVGSSRTWPIFPCELKPQYQITLTARQNGRVLAEGQELRFSGLHITVSQAGVLEVRAPADATIAFGLELAVDRGGKLIDRQTLTVRRAPPNHPISYIADLVDDLIRIFWDNKAGRFLPVKKDGFDQYFRRLQAQGVTRLVVWQSPFPLITDPANYDDEDWRRFELQAQAIRDSEDLTAGMRTNVRLKNYQWLRLLMMLRLRRDFGRIFTQSAADHGIKLTASFRPFEAALTKYYEIPTFDSDGTYLWGFLPLASPAVNYHPDQVGFAHYREILRRMGKDVDAELSTIEIAGMRDASKIAKRAAAGNVDLVLLAAHFPPLDDTSFVLVRGPNGAFKLQPFETIRRKAEARRQRVDGVRFRVEDSERLVIEGIELPGAHRYLVVTSASEFGETVELPVELDVTLRARAGNQLGRANVYCSLAAATPEARRTCVAGIPVDGLYRTEFQAIENSVDFFRRTGERTWRLGEGTLVVDMGADWSVEMVDFNRTAAREYVVRQLRTILAHDAYDEIFVNTRSHTQLAGSTVDGIDGIRPMTHYRLHGKNYYHYGIDRAYAPISLAADPDLRSLADDTQSAERITTWQRGEWQGACQSPDSDYAWRYRRNLAVAQGVRELLKDLEREFPGVRIRAVVPQSESVIEAVQAELATMRKPDGNVYGSEYYRHIWGSLNYIPAIGEGMAMVDLSDLTVEPTFLGIRYLPDQGPLEVFVRRYIEDLANNRGSKFRGPRSFVYEAQQTLRAADRNAARKRREEIIRYLLSHKDDIGEVLLYEAADWTYYLPLSDPDIHGHSVPRR